MTKQITITLFMLLVVSTSSCTAAATPIHAQYLVTGDADGAPIGCRPQDIASRMVEMFAAVNRGDSKLVDEYFGRGEGAPFQWYSMTEIGKTEAEKKHFVAYDWEELAVYFKQRHQQHEQQELRSVQFNGWDPERGFVHFGPVEISRHADDLRPGLGGSENIASGKGAYHCGTKAFVVLSLVMNTEET